MDKVMFLGMDCVGVKVLSQRVSEKHGIFEYLGKGYKKEYARKQKNGKFKTITEDQIAHEQLKAGRGVQYKGHIYFLTTLVQGSEQYRALKQSNNRIESKLSKQIETEYLTYLNGALYDGLNDVTKFSMVKSMVDLYVSNVFSISWLEGKLGEYLKPESVDVVLSEIHESNLKAG